MDLSFVICDGNLWRGANLSVWSLMRFPPCKRVASFALDSDVSWWLPCSLRYGMEGRSESGGSIRIFPRHS